MFVAHICYLHTDADDSQTTRVDQQKKRACRSGHVVVAFFRYVHRAERGSFRGTKRTTRLEGTSLGMARIV